MVMLLSPALASQEQFGTISGTVVDTLTGDGLPGAKVILTDLNIGVATDIYGKYLIQSVPLGAHVIRVIMIGYPAKQDTIHIKATDLAIKYDCHLSLRTGRIKLDPKLEDYHARLALFAKNNELLHIQLDRLSSDKGMVFVSMTLTNKSPYLIYVIKETECFRVMRPIVCNSAQDTIRPTGISLECDVLPRDMIQSSDLLPIWPNASVRYPKTPIRLFYFNSLPSGSYTIRMRYEFGGPSELRGWFRDPVDDAVQKALRGIFVSSNALIYSK
jgi:hypothetical protein